MDALDVMFADAPIPTNAVEVVEEEEEDILHAVAKSTNVDTDVCLTCNIKMIQEDLQMRCGECGVISESFSVKATTTASVVGIHVSRGPMSNISKGSTVAAKPTLYMSAQKTSTVAQQKSLKYCIDILMRNRLKMLPNATEEEFTKIMHDVRAESNSIQQNTTYTKRDNTNVGVTGAIFYNIVKASQHKTIKHKIIANFLNIPTNQLSTGINIRETYIADSEPMSDLETYHIYAREYICNLIKVAGEPSIEHIVTRCKLPAVVPRIIDPKLMSKDKMIYLVEHMVNGLIFSKIKLLSTFVINTYIAHVLWFLCHNTPGWQKYTQYGNRIFNEACSISKPAHNSDVVMYLSNHLEVPKRMYEILNIKVPVGWTEKSSTKSRR